MTDDLLCVVPDSNHNVDSLRTSSYVIHVDLPLTDDCIILHGFTGAYDKVNVQVASWLRSKELGKVHRPLYGQWPVDDCLVDPSWTPSDSTIATLEQRGYLTSLSQDEERLLFVELVESLHNRQINSMPNYVVMPTYDCNLRCNYCFQDHMRTNAAFAPLLRVMSIEMADRIMSAIDKIELDIHGLTDLASERHFTFFGGEPLLARSHDVVKHIIRTQKNTRRCDFIAVSNGTELDSYSDLIGPDQISMIQITLDGPPNVHDSRRIYANGQGSFERICGNIEMAISLNTKITVRVNVDRNNIDGIVSLAEILNDKGFGGSDCFSAYLAPIHDYAGTGKAGARSSFFNSWELRDKVAQLREAFPITRIFSQPDGGMTSRVRQILLGEAPALPKSAFCGAHTNMYIFDAFADIYACWDRTGDQNLKIGSIDSGGEVSLNEMASRWRSRNVVSNPTCQSCKYALNCGGGCAVLAEGASGTIMSNFCDAFGKRFRTSVAEAYSTYANAGSDKMLRDATLVEFLR